MPSPFEPDPPAAPRGEELLRRLRELPAAAALHDVLGGDPGVHLVGGAVRDVLLGARPLDLDVVVEGDVVATAERLAGGLGGELHVHDRFGTATVAADGRSYDLVRARAETYARPGALPDVRPGTLEQDLLRRDFTVNAIAVALDGRLASAPDAFADLAGRRLRVLHDASFRDDPTRLLRLVRYATRLGFSIEEDTAALADAAIEDGALRTVTGTRVGGELRLLLREPAAVDALARVAGWGGGDALVPGLAFDAELAARARALLAVGDGRADPPARRAHPPQAPAGRADAPPAADGRADLLLLAVACRRVPDRQLARWLDDLGFAARERDTVLGAARGARRVAARLEEAGDRASAVADALRGASPELAALAGATGGPGSAAAAAAARWLGELRHVRLAIDGDDLRAAGVPQGEAIGRGLAAALRAKLDGAATEPDAELAAALAAARDVEG